MYRFALFEKYHNQPNILRKLMRYSSSTLSKMLQYNITDFDQNDEDDEGDHGSFFFERKKQKKKDKMEERSDLFLPEYALTCGLPRIEGIEQEDIER
jgi:transcriptional activator SPT7